MPMPPSLPEPRPGQALYAAPRVERHSRLTTFFRFLLVIPHAIWLSLYGLVAYVAVVIAWLAILVTGRYPAGLYAFVGGFAVYSSRVSAYLYLLSDVYPPFSGSPGSPYPVELRLGERKASYSRLSALIRIVPLVVVYVLAYVLSLVAGLVVTIAWLVVIVLGRLPDGLHDTIAFCLSYLARSTAYAFLLTESFPAFDGSGRSAGDGATTSSASVA